MAANGINAVRTYTVPPRWLLDLAAEHGLLRDGRPAVGAARRLPRRRRRAPRRSSERVRAGVRALRRPPGGPLLRDRQRDPGLDRALARAPAGSSASSSGSTDAAKDEDPERARHLRQLPDAPSTSSSRSSTSSASTSTSSRGDRVRGLPRAAAEPRRRPAAGHGRDRPRQPPQRRGGAGAGARLAGRAPRSPPAAPGAFVFAWTDEWHRGGFDIDDWDFGLVDRERAARSRRSPRSARRSPTLPLPRRAATGRAISVVVCTLQRRAHAAATASTALRAARLSRLRGDRRRRRLDRRAPPRSRASTASALISTENRGLASARNTGLEAATGEIVAYIDDDAWPDPHWLTLPRARVPDEPTTSASAGRTSRRPATARSPSASRTRPAARSTCCSRTTRPSTSPAATWPSAATRSRRSAASTRSSASRATTSTSAGGCRTQGWTVGFSPGAVVWHHRRDSRARLPASSSTSTARPRRCSSASGPSATTAPATSPGPAASTATASRTGARAGGAGDLLRHLGHRPVPVGLPAARPALLGSLPLMPEWYLVIAALAVDLRAGHRSGRRSCSRCRCCVLAVGRARVRVARSAAPRRFVRTRRGRAACPRLRMRARDRAALHAPAAARLGGRLRLGLAPWRRRVGPAARAARGRARAASGASAGSRPTSGLRGIEARARGRQRRRRARRRLRALGPPGPRRRPRRGAHAAWRSRSTAAASSSCASGSGRRCSRLGLGARSCLRPLWRSAPRSTGPGSAPRSSAHRCAARAVSMAAGLRGRDGRPGAGARRPCDERRRAAAPSSSTPSNGVEPARSRGQRPCTVPRRSRRTAPVRAPRDATRTATARSASSDAGIAPVARRQRDRR